MAKFQVPSTGSMMTQRSAVPMASRAEGSAATASSPETVASGQAARTAAVIWASASVSARVTRSAGPDLVEMSEASSARKRGMILSRAA
nr:hypothetical protein [Rubellimicrobium mesophilum]